MSSDALPDRTIGGLPGRSTGEGGSDLRRLRKQNRPAVAPARPQPRPPQPAQSAGDAASAPSPSDSAPEGRATPAPPTATGTTKRTTVYISADTFSRARGAYRATAHQEQDRSWSDFVDKALAAEAVRREAIHNSGSRFEMTEKPLSPGRPINPD